MTDTIGLIARVLLGAAFVLAGASKLAAGRSWPAQARDLGAPRWSIPAVPWIELVLGAGLIVQIATPWSAVAALVMLLAFSALLVLRMAQGRRPPCACFGAWSARPLGPGHLVRNGVLLAIGVAAIIW